MMKKHISILSIIFIIKQILVIFVAFIYNIVFPGFLLENRNTSYFFVKQEN